MTLNLPETSVVKSLPSVPHGTNLFSRQNFKTLDISHAILPLTVAKLSTPKTVRFLTHLLCQTENICLCVFLFLCVLSGSARNLTGGILIPFG